jgi:hypothetical protein
MSEHAEVSDPSRPATYPRAQKRLLVGALLGLAAALLSVIGPGPAARDVVPDDAVALVNGRPLHRATVARAAELVAADRKPPATVVPTDLIVKRLIEEELLVQRALAVGIVDADANVRRTIVRAMLDSIVLDAESATLQDSDLREFFEVNRDLFGAAPRLEVERVVFRERLDGLAAASRAESAAAALRAGVPLADVRERYGDEPVVALPAGPLSPPELAEYLGPTAAERLASAELGSVTPPLGGDDGLQVLRLRSRVPAPPVTLERDRALVESVYRKQRVDRALREYLERLWNTAKISFAQDRPR